MSVDDTVIAELTMRRVLGAHGRLGTSTRTMNLDGSLNQTFVGSESAPQRIYVNTNFPEQNSPFLIVHVNQAADQNNTYHEAYNISLPVDVPDIEKLTLSIPPGPPFNRVLARFPVLSHWSTNGERLCEAFSPGQRCNGFRDAYLEFLRDVKEDEDRVWFYAMLVFPTDVDNTIFSGNSPTLRSVSSFILLLTLATSLADPSRIGALALCVDELLKLWRPETTTKLSTRRYLLPLIATVALLLPDVPSRVTLMVAFVL